MTCLYGYNTTERNEYNMSFCGMVLFENGIAAFSDSKATTTNWLNQPVNDKNRNPIKILKNKNVIIVTTGSNHILSQFNEIVKLEDLLLQYIEMYSKLNESIDWLIDNILKHCQYSIEKDRKCSYQFLIGFKRDGKYRIKSFIINNNKCEISNEFLPIPGNAEYYYIGSMYYVNLFKQFYFERNYNIENVKDMLIPVLESLITIGDRTLTYNPVGLPINIEIFQ